MPGGDRGSQAEGVPGRDHPLANLEVVRVAEAGRKQIVGLDLDHCQVGLRVASDDLGGELALIDKLYRDLVGSTTWLLVRI